MKIEERLHVQIALKIQVVGIYQENGLTTSC